MSGWTEIWDLIKETAAAGSGNIAGAESTAAGSPAVQAAGRASGTWGAITGFLVALTDWHLWASLGWLVAGLVLIIIGISLWLRLPQRAAPLGLL